MSRALVRIDEVAQTTALPKKMPLATRRPDNREVYTGVAQKFSALV
jgi:hypothetical protein